MKKLLLLFLCILITTFSYSTNYYVSPNGNDANNGTSISTPWKTIEKVNAASIKPGDGVYFEKGGIYRGYLIAKQGNSTSPVTIGNYGSGANPLFLGSQKLNTWTTHQNNIWKVTTNKPVMYVFQDDSLLTLARYPNTGWLRNKNGSNVQIQDFELTQPDGYWNGAKLVIRSTGWSYSLANVSSYTKGVLNFPSINYNLASRQWGYFICNKLSELDSPGEWFWDSSNSTLYLWPLNNVNPNNSNIELATEPQAIRIAINYVNLFGIDCKYYTAGNAGALSISGNYNSISNCAVIKSGKGLTIYGSNNTIKNNIFEDIYTSSLVVTTGDNNLIEGNTLTDCGVVPGLGEHNWGYFGIGTTGFGNKVKYNKLNRIGYIALAVNNDALVEYNFINNACYILNDGSGITFDRADGATIRYNIVLNTIGNVESCAPNYEGCKPKGKGIYFGNISNKNVTVSNNTVAHCNGAGIWVDHTMVAANNKVINNNLYNNNLFQLGLGEYSNYNGPGATEPYIVESYTGEYTGNICFGTNSEQLAMHHINYWFVPVDFGLFANNYYYSTVPNLIALEIFKPGHNTTNYSLSQWKALRNDDLTSVQGLTSGEHQLIYNDSNQPKTVSLTGKWKDVQGNEYSSVNLNQFESKILIKSAEVPPCTFVYSNWSACVNGKQTRTYTSSPVGCTGVPPTDSLSKNCTIPSITCIFTYSNWSACVNGKQTRTVLTAPSCCVGLPPIDSLYKSCVIPCTFTYSNWSACVDGKQTRTVLTTLPSCCVGEAPLDSLSKNCTIIVPCTFVYSNWSACVNGKQTRTYTSSPVGCTGVPPTDSLSKNCTIPPPTNGKKVVVVVNTNDPTSANLANTYISSWGLSSTYIVNVSIPYTGTVANNTTSLNNAINSIKAKATEIGTRDVVLAWQHPTKFHLSNWGGEQDNAQSITSAIAVGPRNPGLYTVNNTYQVTNSTTALYPVLLWNTQQIKANANKTNPQGKFVILAAKDQSAGGYPRGTTIANLSQNVKNRSDVLFIDNRNDTRIGNGNNDFNNLSDLLFTLKNKVPAPSCCPNIGAEPPVVGYFGSMYALCCGNQQTYVNGWGAFSFTSFSGEVTNVGQTQTDFTFFTDSSIRGTGAAWSGGPVSEPNTNLTSQCISPDLFIPYVKDQGLNYGRALWASTRMTDRFLFVGDPLCAPWEK